MCGCCDAQISTAASAAPRDGLSLAEANAWCQSLPGCFGMWYYDMPRGRCCPKASWDALTFDKQITGGGFYQVQPMEAATAVSHGILTVQLDGWSPCNVPLDRCGDFRREIKRECGRADAAATPWHETGVCVFSVVLIDGAMVVTCRSTLVVCNASSVDIDIKMVDRR